MAYVLEYSPASCNFYSYLFHVYHVLFINLKRFTRTGVREYYQLHVHTELPQANIINSRAINKCS